MFVPLSVLEFRDRAERYFGEKVGVIDGERSFTYRAYGERTHRLANALVELGVEPGDRVSLITYNTHHLLEAYYGVLEAGAVLNPINIRLSARDIAYILDHSGARVVFFHRDFTPLVESLVPLLTTRPRFIVLEGETGGVAHEEYEAFIGGSSAEPRRPQIDENAVAELFYTSGTTGVPKGVPLTHRELYLHSMSAQLSVLFEEDDVVLHVVPLFHVNGWGVPHFLTMVGGQHVMLRKFDPVALMDLVARHHVTRLLAVPAIFNALLHHHERPRFDLSSLREVIIGGAPASPALVRALAEELHCDALVGYGLTETSPILTLAHPRQVLTRSEPPDKAVDRRAMTGWPLVGVNLRVVNSLGIDVRPDGEQIGEIIVRGNTVMHGYYHDQDGTNEAVRDGWFHTGDMAVIDEAGYVLIKDRAKDIVIRGGENVSSVEIENALLGHPAVMECAVVSAPDEKFGEAPVALVVLKPDATATAKELRAHCRKTLARYKIPRDFEFRDTLPKGGTGKILKGELREAFWGGRGTRVN